MTETSRRFASLDGVRALSILFVLAAHLMPLGPKGLQLNGAAGLMGMALFFALSGFLIVSFLADDMPLPIFAVRRLARIVPLAWLAMVFLWLWHGDVRSLLANLLFVANLPPAHLMPGGHHLWSLCVEVQFYVAVAILCMTPKRVGLNLIPALAIIVTALRILDQQPISIVTWHRVDEILAGGIVALALRGKFGSFCKTGFAYCPFPLALGLLAVCSHPALRWCLYFRPYAGGLVLGCAIQSSGKFTTRVLSSRIATYIAEVSYALYVVHGVLTATWLGEGAILEKYLKRPLLLGATFLLAHLSTFYMEKPITKMAKRLLGPQKTGSVDATVQPLVIEGIGPVNKNDQ